MPEITWNTPAGGEKTIIVDYGDGADETFRAEDAAAYAEKFPHRAVADFRAMRTWPLPRLTAKQAERAAAVTRDVTEAERAIPLIRSR